MSVVPGHHHDFIDAELLQAADNILRFCTKRIGNQNDCGKLSFHGKVECRMLRGNRLYLVLFSLWNRAMLILKNKVIASDMHMLSFINTGNTVRHNIFYFGMTLSVMKFSSLRFRNNGICHGVRVMLFQTSCHTEHLIFLFAVEGDNLLYFRLGISQGSRLIKDDGIRFGNHFHKLSALYRNVVFSGFPHSGENRYGHG